MRRLLSPLALVVGIGIGAWSADLAAQLMQLTDGTFATKAVLFNQAGGAVSISGTEYTEADTDTTITGTAILWEDSSDTLRAVSAAKPLPVSLPTDATELPAAVLLADNLSLPTTPLIGAVCLGYDGTNLDLCRVSTGGSGAIDANTSRITIATDDIVNDAAVELAAALFVDDAAFTPATSQVLAVGFEADETSPDSVDEGDVGAPRMTLTRKIWTVLGAPTGELGATVRDTGSSDSLNVAITDSSGNQATLADLYVHDGALTLGSTRNAISLLRAADATVPTAVVNNDATAALADVYGSQFARTDHINKWDCDLDDIGTTLTECKAAPGASLSLYVTGYIAGSTTGTAGQHLLRFGTGTNCGTGTTTLFPGSGTTARAASPANTVAPTVITFPNPLKITANNALCVIGVATNTTWITVNGFTAP